MEAHQKEMNLFIEALDGPIVVTGAAGFVGANLLKRILSVRGDVIGVVREEKGWRISDIADELIVATDLNDQNAVSHLVDSIRPKTVFDCISYGAYSFEGDEQLIYRTNFTSVVYFANALAREGIKAYIHAGTSSEYGTNCSAPEESAQRLPNSHYAVSKSATSDYLHYLGKEKRFPCVNLRLYSVYGALEDTSRLIPTLLKHAVQGHLPPFVDRKTSRDFVHINDVCDAFIMAAARMNPDIYGESFNIGTGVCTTIEDLAALTLKVFDFEAEPQYGTMKARDWDLAAWYANPDRAQSMLGWKASIPLGQGLEISAEWVRTLSESDIQRSTKLHQTERKRSLSAIIACYKDEPAIPIMYQRLTDAFVSLGIDYEIIFVNDGSPDASAEVIEAISAKDPRVLGITHSRNFGSQMAFRSGMELSTKDGVVLFDGDLQDPPELIPPFYEQWMAGFDVVYGRRVKREMPWIWGLMYKLFYRVFAAFSYIPIPHDAGDFSLMDRRVVLWVLQCPERDLFMRGLRAYVGFKQTGVDYVRPERLFGVSTNNLLKNIGWAKKGIFSFSDAPLSMLTTSGIILLAISVIAAIVLVTLRLTIPDIAPRGITTVLLTILFFGSLNLFAVGVVGEYVAKIMIEVKGRPRLIRSGLIRNGKTTPLVADGRTPKST